MVGPRKRVLQTNGFPLTVNTTRVGRGGALVESMTFNRRVVGSTPALAAVVGSTPALAQGP